MEGRCRGLINVHRHLSGLPKKKTMIPGLRAVIERGISRIQSMRVYHLTTKLFGIIIIIKQSRYTPWWHLGERRYSSYSFLTSALVVGEWLEPCPLPLFAPGIGPRYSLYRRLGGPHSWSGHRAERKNPLPCLG
jgi:hypothetical protein